MIPNNVLCENPFWDCKSQCLFFADLASNRIHRYDLRQDRMWTATIDGIAGAQSLIPMKRRGCFAVAVGNTMWKVRWNGYSSKATIDKKIFTVNDGTTDKIHIAIAGPRGCGYYGGTYSPIYCSASNQTAFYYTKRGGVRYISGGSQVTSGFVWSCYTK